MRAIRIAYYGITDYLQIVCKWYSIVFAKLTYASPAWWGFTTADHRNRMEGLLRRGSRAGLYNGPTLSQTIEDVDDRLLLSSIMYNEHHLLHRLLPERHHNNYSLKSRRHDLTLSANTDRWNFILKTCISRLLFCTFLSCLVAVWQPTIKIWWWWWWWVMFHSKNVNRNITYTLHI